MTDEERMVLEVIRHELQYRRDKQWKIFAWSTTLLLAAIGVVFTLQANDARLNGIQITAGSLAVMSICLYGCKWIRVNIQIESTTRTALIDKLQQHGLPQNAVGDPDPPEDPAAGAPMKIWNLYGYELTIVILTVAAVVAFASHLSICPPASH